MRRIRSAKACFRCSGALIVAVIFLWQQSVPALLSQTAKTPPISVPPAYLIVLVGQDGVNIIKAKKVVAPVVEVRDKVRRPVAGLYVTFISPNSGPHVTFAHGRSTYSTVTDADGRAMVHEMKAVGQGPFKINVTAAFHGETITASIAQTNYLTLAAASSEASGAAAPAGTATTPRTAAGAHGISKALIVIICAGVAGGAGAALAVSKGGGNSTTTQTSTSPTGTIGGTGSTSIGPPH